MNRFVLDASVSTAWFLPTSNREEGFSLSVRTKLSAGGQAVVPALWLIEMANVLAKSYRKGVMTEQEGATALGQLEILMLPRPSRIEVHSAIPAIWQAYGLARKYGVSAYDGIYLGLAVEENLPLATLDKDLRAGATRAGVKLLI